MVELEKKIAEMTAAKNASQENARRALKAKVDSLPAFFGVADIGIVKVLIDQATRVRAPYKRLTPEQKAKVEAALKLNNATTNDIATKFGVSSGQVHSIKVRLGLVKQHV